MSRLWSRALEVLGRIRIFGPTRKKLQVGDPTARDARSGTAWRAYLDSERLFDVWGPLPDSPWPPYHSVPLFAALDRMRHENIGPTAPADRPEGIAGGALLPPHVRPDAPPPPWLAPGAWVIVDLPGPAAVQVGAWLVRAGCQPVCTFDNWPHPKGVLRPERTLAELLRWASTVASARGALDASSIPVWICDNERLGTHSGKPGEFDNRYFLDDSILPAPTLLKRAGILWVAYMTTGDDLPLLDLEAYFAELLTAGIPVLHIEATDPTLAPRAPASDRTRRRLSRSGYRRSAAGGFGSEVPEPSSGGGG